LGGGRGGVLGLAARPACRHAQLPRGAAGTRRDLTGRVAMGWCSPGAQLCRSQPPGHGGAAGPAPRGMRRCGLAMRSDPTPVADMPLQAGGISQACRDHQGGTGCAGAGARHPGRLGWRAGACRRPAPTWKRRWHPRTLPSPRLRGARRSSGIRKAYKSAESAAPAPSGMASAALPVCVTRAGLCDEGSRSQLGG
jgi:hypothetical protein